MLSRTDLSLLDVSFMLMFYQLALYVMVRLGRRAFTLGELGAVGHGATAMFMETVYVTCAKVRFQDIFRLYAKLIALYAVDLAAYHTIPWNIPPSDPSFDIPTGPHPGCILYRISPLAPPRPLS